MHMGDPYMYGTPIPNKHFNGVSRGGGTCTLPLVLLASVIEYHSITWNEAVTPCSRVIKVSEIGAVFS